MKYFTVMTLDTYSIQDQGPPDFIYLIISVLQLYFLRIAMTRVQLKIAYFCVGLGKRRRKVEMHRNYMGLNIPSSDSFTDITVRYSPSMSRNVRSTITCKVLRLACTLPVITHNFELQMGFIKQLLDPFTLT